MFAKSRAKLALVPLALFTAFAAHAGGAVDPFTTALTSATAKVGEYASALVGLSAVAVVFMIAMKYVKRIPRAS
jgi:hypothetical protein